MRHSLALTVLSTLFTRSWTQEIFITMVSAYTDLATCAEQPLSAIVQDMAAGCGDGQAITSHGCFCTESSSQMAEIISSEVMNSCLGNLGDANGALSVFSEYCALGTASVPATTESPIGSPTESPANTITETATPANTATTLATSTVATSIRSSTASAVPMAQVDEKLPTMSKIVIGVVVPVAVILIFALVALFSIRHRRRLAASRIERGPEAPPKDLSINTTPTPTVTDQESQRTQTAGGSNSSSSSQQNQPRMMMMMGEAPGKEKWYEFPPHSRYSNNTAAREMQTSLMKAAHIASTQSNPSQHS